MSWRGKRLRNRLILLNHKTIKVFISIGVKQRAVAKYW
jgi:hypothetical protein